MAHQEAGDGHHRSNAKDQHDEELDDCRFAALSKSPVRLNRSRGLLQIWLIITLVIENDVPGKRRHFMRCHKPAVVWGGALEKAMGC
jgi:hypothetical protein